ncbi:MAG TPA: DDE-type integrase/transposase/recombinase [Actinomycetes bacterium]|nr:DDE-type integrase/transposase/recombinase [Actinomycetes bacterium]
MPPPSSPAAGRPDPSEHAERVALLRYRLIAEAANPRLPAAERGRLVRALAARAHEHPDGSIRSYSRGTLDRWISAYQAGGLEALRPVKRADAGVVRRHPELLAEAAALRAERPARSAAHIADILRARHGITVSERTIRAHLARKGLDRAALRAEPAHAFGRYEAERPNERWIGDVLVGPFVPHPRVAGSQRAKLFLLVDDHSRLLIHGRWVTEENTRAGQEVLRAAIVRRGLPEVLYVDNGAPYANQALERCCAVLGIRLVHSQPHRPQGRGKQERLNRVIRERFLLEAEAAGIASLDELNDRFAAWAEQVLNTRVHAETGQPPIARFLAGGPPRAADPVLLVEAFRWSATRVVAKTATVSLAGNRYQVDPSLIGCRVELRYDPEDLSQLTVYVEGAAAGIATPLVVGRHTHPAVPQAARPAPTPTGIDYLGLVLAAHEEQTVGQLAYRTLALPGLEHLAPAQDDPGQDDPGADDDLHEDQR